MAANKGFYNINYLGHIPFNPDLFLEKGRFKDRPVGILYTDLIKMYWSIRSFRVDISIQVIAQDDPLTAFIRGGGSTGGIASALGGLANVNQSLSAGDSELKLGGYTKISHRYEKYIRKIATTSIPFEGIKNNKLDRITPGLNELEKDPNIKINPLITINSKPNEASLCVPGPLHKIVQGGAFLSIDFSDIIYYQKRYWPKIIFLGSTRQASFSFNPLNISGRSLTVFGSIGLLSYNIPVYGSIEFSPDQIIPPIAIVLGSIKAGNRCCDRFFYDGFDEKRSEECKNECGDGPQGVYTKEKVK
jgi:hypothetical protein